MKRIVVLATAWGTVHGGINAFNADFCTALAAELADKGKVYCAVIGKPSGGLELATVRAGRLGVTLIPIDRPDTGQSFDQSWARDVIDWLDANAEPAQECWWVGHDIKSGAAALLGARETAGRAAIISHMAYLLYGGRKSSDGAMMHNRHREQMAVLQASAHIFAVGPLLRDFVEERTGRTATMLVPGFPDTDVWRGRRHNSLSAMTFGRLDQEDDRIKQGRLALMGFANAIRVLGLDAANTRLLGGHVFTVLGVNAQDQIAELRRSANAEAGRLLNLYLQPYDTDRDRLLERVSEASIGMMLSVQEGFGLTAWETIGLGVPAIISGNSGVGCLIGELGPEAGPLAQVLDIQGKYDETLRESYTPADLQAVSRAVRHMATNLSRASLNALELRTRLQSRFGCTWRGTARTFLEAIANPAVADPSAASDAAPSATTRLKFRPEPATNRFPKLAELGLSTVSGSGADRCGLLAEARFGYIEVEVGDRSATLGLTGAELALRCSGAATVLPGTRLGDSETDSPDIAACPNLEWHILGPRQDGVLYRRAIGERPLCEIGTRGESGGRIDAQLSTRRKQLDVRLRGADGERALTVAQLRVLDLVLSRLFQEDGKLVLSAVALVVDDEHDGTT